MIFSEGSMTLVLGVNEVFRAEIEAAQDTTNIDGSSIAALIDAEAAKIKSGPNKGRWDKSSFNSASGAGGMTQFLEATWIGHAQNTSHLLNIRAKAAGFINNANKVIAGQRQNLLDLRFDPRLSIVSAAEYGLDNLKSLSNAGVLPGGITDDQRARYMYLAHHEGPGGAVGFLNGSKSYTRANLVKQVGASKADSYIAQSGGDTSAAYRKWLNAYMDEKIVPAKFRDGASPLPGSGAGAPAPGPAAEVLPAGHSYVTTEGLNFRKEPMGEIIRSLTIGQAVTVISRIGDTQWYRVDIDGTQGAVSGAYLRAPIAPAKERLLEKLIAEWVRFKKGNSSEEDEPYNTYVHEMWLLLGENWYGNSKYPDGQDVPWSAAFISFVVANSGPEYADFLFDASHSVFSNDAIRARIMSEHDKPFWAYRIGEKKPEIGDIIHRNRLTGTQYTYDYTENHAHFPSHSDIVCEVRGKIARVIGGNTGGGEGTVALDEYELDDDGFLAKNQKIIALLKNRSDEV
jgi:Uncharacterized protein conserved in bacteria (DUF2272)